MTGRTVRLVLAGEPGSEIARAADMARGAGAAVAQASDVGIALDHIRARGGDLAMVDVRLDIKGFITALRAENLSIPVIACGIDAPARRAVEAIHAGARDYVPLPPDHELIAAALMTVTAQEMPLSGASIDTLVGQTVASVERDLILRTLGRHGGNRTSASAILGISVRTMRNKLREFAAAGFEVR